MEEKKTFKTRRITKDEMDDLTKEIDSSLERFLKEGKYKDVLISMGNLGHYSLNNQIYIIMQKPDARTTYGMKKWNSLFPSSKLFTYILKSFSFFFYFASPFQSGCSCSSCSQTIN